jgi:hypothetical protein
MLFRYRPARRTRGLTAAALVAAGACLLAAAPVMSQAATSRAGSQHAHRASRHAQLSTSITIDGARRGSTFQGIGAVSGGGGNSRLLIDYPAKQQQQILDYLFKPGYGASLQILKIEIGGDAYASDGAEPSIEHSEGLENCGAGYEFWLAQQARKLNPHIALYGLQWNAPGWVGGGGQNAWTANDISYIMSWLKCATAHHLRINYIGGWNEHLPKGITPAVMSWFVNLRKTLNTNGYSKVQIIGVDSYAKDTGRSDVSDYFAAHPQFRSAISVLGYHNLCRYPVIGKVCAVPAAARASHKPIWESEVGALRESDGDAAMARSLDDAYIRVGVTGILTWPLLSSMPGNLPLEGRGLVVASEPWVGQYKVNEMAWIIGQTTDFTRPGWVHVLGANSELTSPYGSYNTYEAPNRSAWSLVAQTTTATAAQTVSVHVTGGLPHSTVHVWSTNVNATDSADWMVHHADVHAAGGSFSYTLEPGYIYTFTTLANTGRGTGVSPNSSAMPLPYNATPDPSNEPVDLGTQDGAFEYLSGSTTTFEQTAVGAPVYWEWDSPNRFPYAVVGDGSWTNYTVSASVSFTASGQTAGLIARFDHPLNGTPQNFDGYQFVVGADGSWQLVRNSASGGPTTLASGIAGSLPTTPGTGTWTTISLHVSGDTITVSENGTAIETYTDTSSSEDTSGDAGISTGGWYPVQFQDLSVTSG